jgi:hypothetical protein
MTDRIPSRVHLETIRDAVNRLLADRFLVIEGRRPYLGLIRSERLELHAILATLRTTFRSWLYEWRTGGFPAAHGWPVEIDSHLQSISDVEYNLTCRVDPIVYGAADHPDWRPTDYHLTEDEWDRLQQARSGLLTVLDQVGEAS